MRVDRFEIAGPSAIDLEDVDALEHDADVSDPTATDEKVRTRNDSKILEDSIAIACVTRGCRWLVTSRGGCVIRSVAVVSCVLGHKYTVWCSEGG
jgi:hypothetical protein